MMANSISRWLLLSVAATCISAQSVAPSNDSSQLGTSGENSFLVTTSIASAPKLELEAMVNSLKYASNDELAQYNITGTLLKVDSTNVQDITNDSIAFLSCDAGDYPGLLSADSFLNNALNHDPQPAALILYSATSDFCEYSSAGNTYANIFSTMSIGSGQVIKAATNSNGTGSIVSDDSTSYGSSGTASQYGRGSSNGMWRRNLGGQDHQSTPLLTVQAMIILYSITGLITALFLGIIITGAVRAHRHPERYGPRNIIGRPRQSRAKGIARAMLETIPIVRFGDADSTVPKKGSDEEQRRTSDVEMGAVNPEQTTSTNANASTNDLTRSLSHTTTQTHAPPDQADEAAVTSAAAAPINESDNGTACSICTEDFVKGEDIRVLPCDHRFHPACVDPWLLNVSGTCPLCRIDLNKDSEGSTHGDNNGEGNGGGDANAEGRTRSGTNGSDLPPPLLNTETNDTSNTATTPSNNNTENARSRNRIRSLITRGLPGRVADSTAEQRISALRTLRNENVASGAQSNPNTRFPAATATFTPAPPEAATLEPTGPQTTLLTDGNPLDTAAPTARQPSTSTTANPVPAPETEQAETNANENRTFRERLRDAGRRVGQHFNGAERYTERMPAGLYAPGHSFTGAM